MNKSVKNFSRYTFHADGTVTNTASGKSITLKTADAYQLLNDAGKKVTVKIGVVKSEAGKAPAAAPEKKAAAPKKVAEKKVATKKDTAPKKAAPKKKAEKKFDLEGKSHKPTLNYALAQEIRKKIAGGLSKADAAKEYGVSTGTIYFTCNYTNYPVKDGDKIHIPYPDGWKPRKERNAAKAKAAAKK